MAAECRLGRSISDEELTTGKLKDILQLDDFNMAANVSIVNYTYYLIIMNLQNFLFYTINCLWTLLQNFNTFRI